MSSTQSAKEELLAKFTPTQALVFDELLAVGTERPTMPPGLPEELKDIIITGTAALIGGWTEPKLWLSKSKVEAALRCEGQLIADAAQSYSPTLHPATAVGIATHKAIQLANTHPGKPVVDYVDAAITAALSETAFNEFWNAAPMATQSDLMSQMISRTTSFLDSFPPLISSWTPRFEESIQARLGKLVLSAKPDFTLGRPRPDRLQNMFLADMKTGSINDTHFDEAMFYALVSTLRHGVAPFRSVVFSLASGEWTDPDVTPERLRHAANRVVTAVGALTDVLAEKREPTLSPGRWCSWCPASATCSAATL